MGECCRSGRYHFTAVDLLGFIFDSKEIFVPSFDNGMCPFLEETGCMMQPSHRPYNCVTFICDRLDSMIGIDARLRFSLLSDELLEHYRKIEELFSNRFMYGILDNGKRFAEGRSSGIFWSGDGNNK
jgi:hypothetical protein